VTTAAHGFIHERFVLPVLMKRTEYLNILLFAIRRQFNV
jgi:hypothetical protein